MIDAEYDDKAQEIYTLHCQIDALDSEIERLHAALSNCRKLRDELLALLGSALRHVESESDDTLATMIRTAIAKANAALRSIR
jgi:hypothetical protein